MTQESTSNANESAGPAEKASSSTPPPAKSAGRAKAKPPGRSGSKRREAAKAKPAPQKSKSRAGAPSAKQSAGKTKTSAASPAAGAKQAESKPTAGRKSKSGSTKAETAGKAKAVSTDKPHRTKTKAKGAAGASKTSRKRKQAGLGSREGGRKDSSETAADARIAETHNTVLPDLAEAPVSDTAELPGWPAAAKGPQEHLEAIGPMAEQLREPQSFRDLVADSIDTQPSLGWEKKLLAKWAQRKRK